MSSGALFGWRRTLPHLGGVLLGFAVVLSAAIFGLGAIVQESSWLIAAVRIIGATWLTWMSIRFFKAALSIENAAARIEKATTARPFRFFEGVLFQWVNPKAIILALSSAGAYITIADVVWLRALIIVGIFFLAGLVGCTSWMIRIRLDESVRSP